MQETWLAAAIVGALAVAGSSGAAAQSWQPGPSLRQWSGAGTLATTAFRIDRPWILRWQGGPGFFADLHPVGGAFPRLLVSEDHPLPGAPLAQQPGVYYLVFTGAQPWVAEILPLEPTVPPPAAEPPPAASPSIGSAELPIPLPAAAATTPPAAASPPAVGSAEEPLPLPQPPALVSPAARSAPGISAGGLAAMPLPASFAGGEITPFTQGSADGGVGGGAGSAASQSPATSRAAVQACVEIASDLARLQCYDRAAGYADPGRDVIAQ